MDDSEEELFLRKSFSMNGWLRQQDATPKVVEQRESQCGKPREVCWYNHRLYKKYTVFQYAIFSAQSFVIVVVVVVVVVVVTRS